MMAAGNVRILEDLRIPGLCILFFGFLFCRLFERIELLRGDFMVSQEIEALILTFVILFIQAQLSHQTGAGEIFGQDLHDD